MAGRFHPYDDRRPERQNEYFINGEGIRRDVIQADICRYLGNDALGFQGYFIRAYRNLTSEMIADLRADSARWEAELSRSRTDRGSYAHHQASLSHIPNVPPTTYPMDVRPPPGPSAPFTTAPIPPYDAYSAGSFGAIPPVQYPPPYPPSSSPFGSGQTPYHPPYTGVSQPPIPPVTAPEPHPEYVYTSNPGHGYDNNARSHAPRYTGPGSYEDEPDYSPVAPAIPYSTPPVMEPRIGMEPRYTPESAYTERARVPPSRERESSRRPR